MKNVNSDQPTKWMFENEPTPAILTETEFYDCTPKVQSLLVHFSRSNYYLKEALHKPNPARDMDQALVIVEMLEGCINANEAAKVRTHDTVGMVELASNYLKAKVVFWEMVDTPLYEVRVPAWMNNA